MSERVGKSEAGALERTEMVDGLVDFADEAGMVRKAERRLLGFRR